MDWRYNLFGEGTELNVLQMGCRSVVVFFICLIFIRISGRRSFGLRTPLDNIIVILLGALLSRAITGASPFLPIVVSSLIFVLLHRFLGWLTLKNKTISKIAEGEKIILYKDGKFIPHALKRAVVSEEDVMQGVRHSVNTDDMSKIKIIYMERNGEISPLKSD